VRQGSDELVSAARTGDESAWRGLYVMHSARIVALVRALPRGDWASSAEDLVAEAWLTAATKMEEFRGSDDAFGGWLFTIARNHASNSHRTAVRRRTDPTDMAAAVPGPADDVVQRVDDGDAVRRLLARLSPREAEVVACIDVGGLDVASTARALGMKPTAVRVARHRALGRLRRIIDEHDVSS
jgi:RNA polymerase sigma-70 factor (ECF subfamily)